MAKFIRILGLAAALSFAAGLTAALAAEDPKPAKDSHEESGDAGTNGPFKPTDVISQGSVTIGGGTIAYEAHAGTLVVHPKGWDDVPPKDEGKEKSDDKNPKAVASMFYVAYFKTGSSPTTRPITFLYNGGPGSSTMWLHMGAFGPKRVVTADDEHTPAAPYSLINNDESLLDASDLVFIDAPATGFSRTAGEGKEKAFWGIDADGYAFSEFITQFLSKFGRWNSPKYIAGESYGTTRSAVLANMLETNRSVDLNGVVLFSQILNFDMSPDGPQFNPGVDLPYQLVLPTYAASALYHHKLPGGPRPLEPFLAEVEHFAMTDYAIALGAGSGLSEEQRGKIAAKLHEYTGMPVEYILKADLRINGGEFEKMLQDDNGITTGRLDTRFSGPSIDPLSKEADYDPQASAISSAYVSVFNNYVRHELKYGQGVSFRPNAYGLIGDKWDSKHQPPGAGGPIDQSANVMPDLANAMKYNPNLHVQLNAGYYDLATPFYEGVYELQHLQIPASLQKNIEINYYESGHMIFAHRASHKALHDAVTSFIRRTSGVKG